MKQRGIYKRISPTGYATFNLRRPRRKMHAGERVIMQGSDSPYFGGFACGRRLSQHSRFCHLKGYSVPRLKVGFFRLDLPPSDALSSWLASADIVSPHETIDNI